MTSEQLVTMEGQGFDREQMNVVMEELGIEIFVGAGRRVVLPLRVGFNPVKGVDQVVPTLALRC